MAELLTVSQISKSFGGIRALHDCSFAVREGSITGLIGPNGSGKTTVFNVVSGYLRADAGEAVFKGRKIEARPELVFASGLARTFQLTRVFERMTVLENMLIAAQQRESWSRSVVRSAGSEAERSRALEVLGSVKLLPLADEPAGTLSYGQRKLLELAYVLMADPALILLDEPASGVNPSLLLELQQHIRDLNGRGVTFLIIEHNLEFLMKLSQTVIVMASGEVVAQGSPAEVRSDPKVLQAYLGRGVRARGARGGKGE